LHLFLRNGSRAGVHSEILLPNKSYSFNENQIKKMYFNKHKQIGLAGDRHKIMWKRTFHNRSMGAYNHYVNPKEDFNTHASFILHYVRTKHKNIPKIKRISKEKVIY